MAEKDFRVQKGLIVADGDVTVPSDHSIFAGTFDTNVAAAGVTLTGTTLAADGSDSNIDINITPKGTGEVNITKVDIDGGAIDGATIATSDITVGTGKTLDVSGGTLTLANDQISGDKVSGGTIGTTTITALAGDLSLGDNNITNVGDINADSISVDAAGTGLNIDFSGGNTATSKLTLGDNLADALNITEGSNSYMKFVTTNSSEQIVFGKNSTFNGTTIADLGTVTTADIDGGTLDNVVIGGATQAAATVTTLTATGNVAAGSGNTGELRTTAGILQDNVTANHKILTVDGTNFYTSETLSVTEVSNRSKTPGGGFGTNGDGIGQVIVLALNIENASNDLFQAAEAFCAMSIKNSSGTIQKRVISKIIGHLNADGGIETNVIHHSGNTTLGNFRWVFHEDPTGASGNNHMTLIFEYTARHDHTNGSADVTTYSVNVNGLSLSGAGG